MLGRDHISRTHVVKMHAYFFKILFTAAEHRSDTLSVQK